MPDSPDEAPKPRKRVTKRQRQIIRTRLKHPDESHSKIASRLGVKQPYVSKELAKPHVKATLVDLMNKVPALQDESLNKKLAEKLEAKETKHFASYGKVVDTREVEDHGTQMAALNLAYELKGHKTKKVDVTSNGDTIKGLLLDD